MLTYEIFKNRLFAIVQTLNFENVIFYIRDMQKHKKNTYYKNSIKYDR